MTRKILEIAGPDRVKFLQGLVTNDVRKLSEAGILYAALLTPQGKYLADFFLVEQPEAILVDVEAALAAGLKQRLSMYKLRADVTVGESALEVRRGTGPAPEGALADPRLAALGWRAYGAEGGDDGSDWEALRVRHVVPETGIELTPDSYILEMGFERLNGVDFRKGCYVGQEVTARMKHKTELKKGLVQVEIEGAAPVGSEITTDEGRPAGRLFTQAGGQALAYLRFDRARGGGLRAGDARLTWKG